MALSKNIDEWLSSDLAALVLKEYLVPVEGKGQPFFPPTFLDSEDKSGYCVDVMKDGTRTCLVDTVGSQANRMEPVFTDKKYEKIIPQVKVKAGKTMVNLCDIGHRIADAFIRNSSISETVKDVLESLKNDNDSLPLAKIAPTSIVFGIWDSRGTQVKVPRIVSSVIRAYDIDVLTRFAQYTPPINYRDDGLLGEYSNSSEKDKRSRLGFNENPPTGVHGGVIAHGDIRRDVVVNLAALRKVLTKNKEENIILQKYILALSMIAATSVKEWYLRQGCLLVRDSDKGIPDWNLVYPDGRREIVEINQNELLKYTSDIAEKFGVGGNIDVEFDLAKSKKEIKDATNSKKK